MRVDKSLLNFPFFRLVLLKNFTQMVSQMSVNELLKGVQQLSAEDFDLFFKKISSLRSNSGNKDSAKEQALLEKINAGMPLALEQRFAQLIAKRDLEMLTDAEYQELLQLTEKSEELQTKRLGYMMELAQLKGLTLPQVVKQYKLHPKPIG